LLLCLLIDDGDFTQNKGVLECVEKFIAKRDHSETLTDTRKRQCEPTKEIPFDSIDNLENQI